MASEDGDVQIVPDSQFVLSCENELTGHSIRVFICPIVMALAFPIFQETLQKRMTANSYDEDIQQSIRHARLLPYPSETVDLRTKLQSSPRCVEELEISVATCQPAVWVNLCWAMHREFYWRQDFSLTGMSAMLDVVGTYEISGRAKYTVCSQICWTLENAAKTALDLPYDDARLKSLLHIASRLHENGTSMKYLSSACRSILELVPSTMSRASLLSQQLLEDECG
ncbi:uncharacterized protein RHO25_003849 [Cercospora beticola]|uniref:Uncharacterized protein n=1 Tax=Cercospora beticola TaxID=122368 RepID=A0ABZ0NI53_CERBT|nr:hypothetical protein RHO25_003849 [Cercospora beticola]